MTHPSVLVPCYQQFARSIESSPQLDAVCTTLIRCYNAIYFHCSTNSKANNSVWVTMWSLGCMQYFVHVNPCLHEDRILQMMETRNEFATCAVVWVRKPNFGSFCCSQPFVCQVWLSSGPSEFFTFSYCASLWYWLIHVYLSIQLQPLPPPPPVISHLPGFRLAPFRL